MLYWVLRRNQRMRMERMKNIDVTQRKGYCTGMSKSIISRAMAQLGKRKSAAKSAAAKANGKKGGRPKKKIADLVVDKPNG